MITEDYVSFETAKLLKEKGFDCTCKVWYSEYTSQFGGEKYTGIEFDNHNRFNENYKFICYAPTLQMAMKWLRKKHILIVLDVENFYMDGSVASWIYHIWCDDNIEESHSASFKTYEEACEAAIKYCLENLI